MAVLGPGTGLGVACLVPGSRGSIVIASEGGHATMAAASQREDAIIDYLRRQFGHVSAERVDLGSGPGKSLPRSRRGRRHRCPATRCRRNHQGGAGWRLPDREDGARAVLRDAGNDRRKRRPDVRCPGRRLHRWRDRPADHGLPGALGIPRTVRAQGAFSDLSRSHSVERHHAPCCHVLRPERSERFARSRIPDYDMARPGERNFRVEDSRTCGA